MSKNFLNTIMIFGGVVLFFGGYFLGTYQMRQKIILLETGMREQTDVLLKENEDLKKVVQIEHPVPDQEDTLSGILKEKREGSLVLEIESFANLSLSPGEKWPTELRTVKITGDTKMIEEYSEVSLDGIPVLKEKDLSVEDLSVNDYLMVVGEGDILNKKEFEALSIKRSPDPEFN